MENNKYILYLNSLHNYNAQNPNAYGEKNVGSEFFKQIAVKRGISTFVKKQLLECEPHLLVLTGHAGDGKTSIMFQVLNEINSEFNAYEKISHIILPSGKKCCCIKDFSELNDTEKLTVLKQCVEAVNNGEFVFMVSNTGPLINTFGDLFDVDEREGAKIELIDCIDDNNGEIKNIKGVKINIINIASVDNTYFSVEFVENMIKPELWNNCKKCDKCDFCHIYRNRNIIYENKTRVFTFLMEHYIWLVEHGIRLTVRSMTEQLSYMITGGYECSQVDSYDRYKMMFFNLFFGYIGLKNNERANCILAIREAKNCNYYNKRVRSDEKLLVDGDYSKIFSNEMSAIINEAAEKDYGLNGWNEFVRRAYLFTNIITDHKIVSNDIEDFFSSQYERFLEFRNTDIEPGKSDTNLILDALSMTYLGKIPDKMNSDISITMNSKIGLTKNVQLITGSLNSRKIKLIKQKTKDAIFDSEHKCFELKLQIEKQNLEGVISLPILNYFEDLRSGIIETNIDPQLSHGIESLKAQISQEYEDDEDDIVEIIVLKNNGNKDYTLEISDDNKLKPL